MQVLSEAVKDAQAQAGAVFNTLKLTPGKIIDININSADNPSPSPLVFNVADKAFATGTRTPLIGGTQTIEGSVSLDIAYSPNSVATLDLATHNLTGASQPTFVIVDPLTGRTNPNRHHRAKTGKLYAKAETYIT